MRLPNDWAVGAFYGIPICVSSDVPVVGDWSGNGAAKIGIWRPGSCQFIVDMNGNGYYSSDPVINWGVAGTPVIGTW